MSTMFRRRRKYVVFTRLAYSVPLGYIAWRVHKFVDLIEDWRANNDSYDGKTKASPMLPVMLPWEVKELSQCCVLVLHTAAGTGHR